ncbi:MAG: SDR family NAD(P)-dependent oxidoreductase [Leptospiraceae bacterium]|nr:SDR family NAD(P)-dependent oxidoreductase [Leptospiraceae bacterium]MDW8305770.1 SDR family NAD(P)-dependent oxidoreductase [Leptospiraceae bacterium]
MKKWEGKVVVITGAGSGIGRALAIALAQRRALISISDIKLHDLEKTADMCRAYSRVQALLVDVSKKDEMKQYPEKVLSEFGQINVIINNAGVALSGRVEETSVEDYEWLMGINWWGVLYGTKYFLPFLRQAGEGHIVNISSLFGLIAVPTQSAYNAAKFAVRGFTESLAQELAGSSIGVTGVYPGGIKTSIAHNARFISGPKGEKNHAEVAERFLKMAQTSAEEAAEQIIRAIEEKKPRLLIGYDALILDSLGRFFPEQYPFFLKMVLQNF